MGALFMGLGKHVIAFGIISIHSRHCPRILLMYLYLSMLSLELLIALCYAILL